MGADKKIQIIATAFILILAETAAYGLNVSPVRIEISVAPSKTYEEVLVVKNTEKNSLNVRLRIEDWFKAVQGVKEGKTATFDWIKIRPQEFELAQDETKEIKIKVKVPKDVKGELNGMLFIEGSPKEIAEGSIGINTSIGVPIYVIIEGTQRFKAEIGELEVISAFPLQLAVKIKNSGNVHIRPTGTIVIARSPANAGATKQSLKIALTLPLNEYNYPILPNSSRTLDIRSQSQLEKGEYAADIKMGYGDKTYRKKTTLKIE